MQTIKPFMLNKTFIDLRCINLIEENNQALDLARKLKNASHIIRVTNNINKIEFIRKKSENGEYLKLKDLYTLNLA